MRWQVQPELWGDQEASFSWFNLSIQVFQWLVNLHLMATKVSGWLANLPQAWHRWQQKCPNSQHIRSTKSSCIRSSWVDTHFGKWKKVGSIGQSHLDHFWMILDQNKCSLMGCIHQKLSSPLTCTVNCCSPLLLSTLSVLNTTQLEQSNLFKRGSCSNENEGWKRCWNHLWEDDKEQTSDIDILVALEVNMHARPPPARTIHYQRMQSHNFRMAQKVKMHLTLERRPTQLVRC